MDLKRYDGCISCVLFQISWNLQTQIIKNRILSDFYWGINCISIISLHICDFSSKSNGSIYIPLRLYCYIYCKFKGLYEHQQETKIPFLAIFDNFSRKLSEINLN